MHAGVASLVFFFFLGAETTVCTFRSQMQVGTVKRGAWTIGASRGIEKWGEEYLAVMVFRLGSARRGRIFSQLSVSGGPSQTESKLHFANMRHALRCPIRRGEWHKLRVTSAHEAEEPICEGRGRPRCSSKRDHVAC